MIQSFRDTEAEKLFRDEFSKRYQGIASAARRKLLALDAATELPDLINPPGNHLEALKGDRQGQYSIVGPPDRDDVTIASMVPTQLARLIEAGAQPGPRLRTVMLGGAAADPRLLDAGWPVVTTYGMTQTCSAVAVDGRPLPNVCIDIAADGEILVTGPTVAGGGTYRTGDLGRMQDGRLVVTGRKTDTIVTGGENVAPAEVESALLEHPAVAEAGVFGRAHPEWGEAVTAHVVLRGQASPDELRGWCAERLAGFKVPKAIVAVDALPRNAAGKLVRRELV